MSWGTVELEPEVREWLEALSRQEFAHVAFYVDLLSDHGPLLGEPYTKQLRGKLRELRFYLGPDAVRVTYWIAPGRRIVLLTVFRKRAATERRHVLRAVRAFDRCREEAHTVDEELENG